MLALVAVKLLIEPLWHIGPGTSLAMVAVAFATGIIASLVADRRDPEGAAERRAAADAPGPQHDHEL